MRSPGIVHFLGRVPVAGAVLRWLASRYEEGSVVTVQHGLNAGLKWRRHHRYVNGYWIGHYELEVQRALARELKPGMTVYDLGANAGFFSVLAARLVGPEGKCVAFDPMPENCASIREQCELNPGLRIEVIQAAVADTTGRGRFAGQAPGCSMGHLATGSDPASALTEVAMLTLDHAAERYGPPDFVKVDVEGAEAAVLEGAPTVLNKIRPVLLLEIHGPSCLGAVHALLDRAGYCAFTLEGQPADAIAAGPGHLVYRSSREAHRRPVGDGA
jgi:FkbM family methyltransferase